MGSKKKSARKGDANHGTRSARGGRRKTTVGPIGTRRNNQNGYRGAGPPGSSGQATLPREVYDTVRLRDADSSDDDFDSELGDYLENLGMADGDERENTDLAMMQMFAGSRVTAGEVDDVLGEILVGELTQSSGSFSASDDDDDEGDEGDDSDGDFERELLRQETEMMRERRSSLDDDFEDEKNAFDEAKAEVDDAAAVLAGRPESDDEELSGALKDVLNAERSKLDARSTRANGSRSEALTDEKPSRTSSKGPNTRSTPEKRSDDWLQRLEDEIHRDGARSTRTSKKARAKLLAQELAFAEQQMSEKSRRALRRVEKGKSATLERKECEKAVRAVLQFAEEDMSQDMTLKPLSRSTRKVVHKVAEECGLGSKSIGKGKRRQPTVFHVQGSRVRQISDARAAEIISMEFGGSNEFVRSQDESGGRKGTWSSERGGERNPGEHAISSKPLDGSNKGHKLLKLMGWSEGNGLGASGDGRRDPVPVTVRQGRQGLE